MTGIILGYAQLSQGPTTVFQSGWDLAISYDCMLENHKAADIAADGLSFNFLKTWAIKNNELADGFMKRLIFNQNLTNEIDLIYFSF